MKLLVVDDAEEVVEAVTVSFSLQWRETEVIGAADGETALDLVEQAHPDLVLLDIAMPGMDGFETLRRIREFSDVPVIMLTAKDGVVDKVKGLELGADDYVTKPFDHLELLARVKALLRRSWSGQRAAQAQPEAEEEYTAGGVTINVARHRVMVDGSQVELRPNEFELLRVLISNRGRVMTRDRLLDLVWGEDEYLDRGTLDVHIRWLRQKLERNPGQPERVVTVRGVGYKFSDEAE